MDEKNKKFINCFSISSKFVVFTSLATLLLVCTLATCDSAPEFTIIGADGYPGERSQQLLASQSANFDVASFKNVHEAIAAHPNLREFASLCEADGVKEIISLDKTPLTVFAPIDRSLSDLVAKSKSSKANSISLIELAKHHIAQGLIAPDENTKYPFQFGTYSNLSPLYLTQSRAAAGDKQQQQQVFVNNAKILATYLIPIDANSDTYQTLHVIDAVIEYAYVNRKAQLRSSQSAVSGAKRTATKKSPLSLDDFAFGGAAETAFEFYDRFGDLQAGQPSIDLYHARAFRGSASQTQRLSISRDEFNLDKLSKLVRQFQQLRGRLYQVNESTSFNTYFLPLNSDELESMLDSSFGQSALTYEAHVIPDQVLFTRTMGLRRAYESLLNRDSSSSQKVSLSLAKTMPSGGFEAADSDTSSLETISRKLLTTPLLLQAKCDGAEKGQFRAGLTNAEILVANIPLSNGVLHLIKKPILITTDSSLIDYINDNDNALSNVVNSIGSRTITALPAEESGVIEASKLNKFRELLVKEREMLSTLSMGRSMNKTILAPSDEAFGKLKYTLRALISGDESLIPKHWDASYRQELLDRIARRHIVLHQTITSDQISEQASGLQVLSENGKVLSFSQTRQVDGGLDFNVESDSSKACLVHHDLIGTNGVLHIIDRVLGEEQETIYSLLESIVLKYKHSLEESNLSSGELNQLIQSNLNRQQSDHLNNQISTSSPKIMEMSSSERVNNPELSIISKSIGQYLEEIGQSNRRQYQLLASSVNISYQLAKLTSRAEGLDDWNDKFKREDGSFTYFVPSDLAWLRLQQAQPELHKPLMYFLEQSELSNSNMISLETGGASSSQEDSLLRVGGKPRSSQSSHRLHKVLERHLANRKITKKDLNQMDSLQTLGATLRLVDGVSQQHLTEGNNNQASSFAALHSIVGATGTNQQQQAADSLLAKFKTIRLTGSTGSSSANIVQASETSNGFVYIIDNVLLLPEDADYIVQTQPSAAISSSLLGAHNSAIIDYIQSLLAPSPFNMSANSVLAICATLILAIAVLLVLALVLLIKKSRQNKANCHQQLESGLTSSSSANSGSTSTTKSL